MAGTSGGSVIGRCYNAEVAVKFGHDLQSFEFYAAFVQPRYTLFVVGTSEHLGARAD